MRTLYSYCRIGSMLVLALAACGRAQPAVDAVDGAQAYRFLLAQTAFGPRNPGSPGHDSCLVYLTKTLRALTDTVELMHFRVTDSHGVRVPPLTNIIGRIAPDSTHRYLLCAHWDTRPRADHDPNPAMRNRPILGADDGASGVAVLLEVATVLRRFRPSVGVDIVFFDGEDWGKEGSLADYFLGSREFAKRWSNYHPDLGILVDMVGDGDLSIPEEGFSEQAAPWLVDRVWAAARRVGADAFQPYVGQQIYDDHIPLIRAGWPVIDIIDFDYPYWHTLADTPDKCSPASLREVSRVLVAVIRNY